MSNDNSPPIYRPTPRRPFPQTSLLDQPPSPLLYPSNSDETPSRTRSFLNLTSSTLFGIYAPTGHTDDIEPPSTPWGTGSQTPASSPPRKPQRPPVFQQPSQSQKTISRGTGTRTGFGLRGITLFVLGMLYGLLVRHLHDDQQLAPFQVEGIIKPSNDWRYLVFWGVAGVALGSLLPWVDTLWEDSIDGEGNQKTQTKVDKDVGFGADWTPVVRSFGAFVGIAFAIRKLPWTSTLQASLTLALVNPVLWYLIDRSKTGFILSATVGAVGTFLLSLSNPALFPSPAPGKNSTAPHLSQDVSAIFQFTSFKRESVEVAIWILSVLFCSCVCFGNIGRWLALSGGGRSKEKSRI